MSKFESYSQKQLQEAFASWKIGLSMAMEWHDSHGTLGEEFSLPYDQDAMDLASVLVSKESLTLRQAGEVILSWYK